MDVVAVILQGIEYFLLGIGGGKSRVDVRDGAAVLALLIVKHCQRLCAFVFHLES